MCAVDQKRPFFLRAGPFLAFLPFKEAYEKGQSLTGSPLRGGTVLTRRAGPYGKPPYRGPYGQTALREGSLRGGFLREGPLRITGKLTGTLTGRASYGEGRSLQAGPLREGKVPYGKGRS